MGMHASLVVIAGLRGDLAAATRELARSAAIADSHGLAGWRDGLRYSEGRLAMRRGDLPAARALVERYLATLGAERHASLFEARTLLSEVHARAGDLAAAERELSAATDAFEAFRGTLPEKQLRLLAAQANDGVDPDLGVATVIAELARGGRVVAAFELAERSRARELLDVLHRASATPGIGARPARAADVSTALDERTALVQYVTGRLGDPTTAFVVTRAGIAAHVLPPVDSLAREIDRFVAIVEAGGDARRAGRAVGDRVIAPLVRALPARVTRLVLVPDGAIARVPFDALVLPDGRYLLQRFAIGSAPSSASFLALRGRATAAEPGRLLAVGDPAFAGERAAPSDSGEMLRASFAGTGGLTRLAASADEARLVARFGGTSQVLTRAEASEAGVRGAKLGDFQVLHFATHALVDDRVMSRSALALAPGGGHDGFLTLADLAALPLRAELVVLSACRTLRGVEVNGEGVQGLATSLLHAGARTVVATRWRIGDERTRPFVAHFYQELSRGLPVAEALREAKLAALADGLPASEWAAFAALGDPLATVPLRSASLFTLGDWRVLLPGALLALFASVYGATRRNRVGGASRPEPS
jgi:CHAT domain-containing protein